MQNVEPTYTSFSKGVWLLIERKTWSPKFGTVYMYIYNVFIIRKQSKENTHADWLKIVFL